MDLSKVDSLVNSTVKWRTYFLLNIFSCVVARDNFVRDKILKWAEDYFVE